MWAHPGELRTRNYSWCFTDQTAEGGKLVETVEKDKDIFGTIMFVNVKLCERNIKVGSSRLVSTCWTSLSVTVYLVSTVGMKTLKLRFRSDLIWTRSGSWFDQILNLNQSVYFYHLSCRFKIGSTSHFLKLWFSWNPSPDHLSSSPAVFQACIGGYWASSVVCSCPLCKRQFDERPHLSVNKVFALIADKYKQTYYGAPGLPVPVHNGTPASMGAMMMPTKSTNPFLTEEVSGEEVVWCDICTGVKQPAVRSCLTCTASYCTEHLQPHQTSSFYSKHPLMDPQEALRGRTCSVHHRLLEVRVFALYRLTAVTTETGLHNSTLLCIYLYPVRS